MTGSDLLAERSMGKIAWFTVAGIALLALPGCASAPMTRGESLASYDNMAPSDGALTKSLIRVSRDEILAAKSIRIVPTTFPEVAAAAIPVKQRILVANAVDRSLCAGLSDRFEVVGTGAPADLTVRQCAPAAGRDDLGARRRFLHQLAARLEIRRRL
jgi:hypothetical protein